MVAFYSQILWGHLITSLNCQATYIALTAIHSPFNLLRARPVPAAYFRAFWPRFARIGEDVGRCTYVVEQLVVLRSAIRARPAPQPVALKAAKHFAHKALGILHKNDCDDGGGFV